MKSQVNQMISMASTRKVQTNGNMRVRYSNLVMTATTKRAVNTKNKSQYNILKLRDLVVILEKFVQK
jgi:hypothetical protein